jgi:peptide/nickel transport system substrate-binding protein
VLLGAGQTLTMALPPSYLGYDDSVPTYENDLEKAEENCRAAWGGAVWDTGFEFTITYNTGNLARQTISEIIKANLEFLNPNFKVNTRGIAWPDFLAQRNARELPISIVSWIPDYADPDNYIHVFYHSEGFYANRVSFSDAEIDALDEEARTTFDPATRELLYSQLANRAYELAPFVLYPTSVPYMIVRDEVQGVYRNPMLSGQLLWKDISKN